METNETQSNDGSVELEEYFGLCGRAKHPNHEGMCGQRMQRDEHTVKPVYKPLDP